MENSSGPPPSSLSPSPSTFTFIYAPEHCRDGIQRKPAVVLFRADQPNLRCTIWRTMEKLTGIIVEDIESIESINSETDLYRINISFLSCWKLILARPNLSREMFPNLICFSISIIEFLDFCFHLQIFRFLLGSRRASRNQYLRRKDKTIESYDRSMTLYLSSIFIDTRYLKYVTVMKFITRQRYRYSHRKCQYKQENGDRTAHQLDIQTRCPSMQIIVTLLELALVTRYNEGSWREGRGAMNAFRWDSVAEDAPCNEIRWSPQIRRLQTIISDRLSISHGLTSPSLLRAV